MSEITLENGEVLSVEMEVLPKVNEVKRFFRVFFSRKVVIFGAFIILVTVVCAIFATWIAPYDPYAQDLKNVLQAPSAAHLLGTDTLAGIRSAGSFSAAGSRCSSASELL